jgi:hypothetical protein
VGHQRTRGDQHVKKVEKKINQILNEKDMGDESDLVDKTALKVVELFPNIAEVKSKFHFEQPDLRADLTITLDNNEKRDVNLFLIKGNSKIQPKNIGAKSFLRKYFFANRLQENFNEYIENRYKLFLENLLKIKDNYLNETELKKMVKEHYPKFTNELSSIRRSFLYDLREYCFNLLKEKYNYDLNAIKHAFNELLLLQSTNIITRYDNENECLGAEEWSLNIDVADEVSINKKRNDSIAISLGDHSLIIRFKFESSPVSSIKLATSFESNTSNLYEINKGSLSRFENLIAEHEMVDEQSNKSNPIGKCNEAIIYYQLLKKNSNVNQVDSEEFLNMFAKNSKSIHKEDIHNLISTSEFALLKLGEFLSGKYGGNYKLNGIQLVPESYIKDKLDTSDLKITLTANQKLYEENFSLKAISKKTKSLTSKNPGIGTILGEQYFKIGTMTPVVREVKKKFECDEIDHKESLEIISAFLGKELSSAPQENLKKGIQALLGKCPLVISFYSVHESVVLEHGDVNSSVDVKTSFPSPIQNTLFWNSSLEQISLRVKFSGGQNKGWTSIKLACDVKINY